MITSLDIHNFRGLKDVSLRGLRSVNLLIGGNDTGKTSVLEALILLLGDGSLISDLPVTFRANQSGTASGNSADDRENFWLWLFYDRNPANAIQVVAKRSDGNAVQLTTTSGPAGNYPNAPQFPMLVRQIFPQGQDQTLIRFEPHNLQFQHHPAPNGFRVSRLSVRPSHPTLDAENYNQIALESGGEQRFEQIMREVEPRLRRLRYAKLPGTNSPLVFADLGLYRAVPATQMGQAFNRILHIYAEVLASKSNVLLIDEVENGIFSDSLPLIWQGLLALCEKENVQIFATTHSRECVMAAYNAARERGKDELSVQRLQIVKGKIEAVRLGAEHLEVASEMGLEVRS